jgi:multidrug efflux pump subunit AcrA (membrane-fusion protein)
MSKLLKYLISIAVLAIGGFIFYNKVYIPKTTYTMMQPSVGKLEVEVFGIGNVGAKDIYAINAQTGGKITEILTDEGKWVKKGDLLVTIDSVDIPQLLSSAKVAVDKAHSEVDAVEKELQSLQTQRKLALTTYRRYAKLKKEAFISQAEYDKVKADLDTVTAQLEATKAHRNSAKIEITKAQKSVEALETKLTRYKIFSPIDGYVINKSAEVAQSVTPSQTILKIVDPKTVWVKAYIDEKISGDVKVGQNAVITLRSNHDIKHSAKVKRIVAQSDAITGEREVDVAFDKIPIPFYINEQAEVSIFAKEYHDIVKIPSNILTYHDSKAGVWLNQNGKAHFQPLKIIAKGEKELGVEGLDKNAKIIISSKDKKPLKEGMSIHL